MTELAEVAVMRTRKPFFKSLPSQLLLVASVGVAVIAVTIPYTPLATPLGLTPLPHTALAAIGGIIVGYVVVSELLKARISVWSSRTVPKSGRRGLSWGRAAHRRS